MERPQAEPVAERPLHATEDGHYRGTEEGPRTQAAEPDLTDETHPVDQQLDPQLIDKWRQN